MIVLLDANVWVSAFLTPKGKSAELINQWKDGAFQNVCSMEILEEIGRTLSEPRILRKYLELLAEGVMGELGEWAEEDFDPGAFDLAAAEKALGRRDP